MAQALTRRHLGLLHTLFSQGTPTASADMRPLRAFAHFTKGKLRDRKESVAQVGYLLNVRRDGEIVSW